MIRIENLTVRFGADTVLDRLALEVAAGRLALLSGANGAGKSTLLRVVAGLTPPSDGRVTVGGHDPQDRAARALLGFVQDQPPLYEYLTVREHLALVARLWRTPVRESLDGLDRFGAARWSETLVRDLSLGTRKKVGLAAATLHRPHVVLLDEPFNALDPEAADELALLLGEWRDEGRTVVVCSHERARVAGLADRHVVLDAGRIRDAGSAGTDRVRDDKTADTDRVPSPRTEHEQEAQGR
ncbi:ABC transporter ATP-binding protein [Streptomyces sp. NPDC021093]|uniref:ABC transporter ATP-binding protein n=1 Tax=Streptomyces sp. NPDC021093 TaxID=3365112 RepID=UPI0037B0C38D